LSTYNELFSYSHPNPSALFPTTQGMGSPSLLHSYACYPPSLHGSIISWLGISHVGNSGELQLQQETPRKKIFSLHRKTHSTGLTTCFFMHFTAPTNYPQKPLWISSNSSTQLLFVVPKYVYENSSFFLYEFSFSPSQLTLTLLNVDCNHPP
jgi:hypothetical protein